MTPRGSLIEREFAADHERSIDKRKLLDPDRFGYLSLHYICGLTPARLTLAEHQRQVTRADVRILICRLYANGV